jgi:hypothetical protein
VPDLFEFIATSPQVVEVAPVKQVVDIVAGGPRGVPGDTSALSLEATQEEVLGSLASILQQLQSALLVASEKITWREDFEQAALDPTAWDIIRQDPGTAIAVGGSVLTLGAGVGNNEQVIIRSKQTFTLPLRIQFTLAISQRIAGNAFVVELVNAAGDTYAGWYFDGTTVTTQKIEFAHRGFSSTASPSAGIAITNSSAAQALYEMELKADAVDFNERPADSSGVATTRASRTRTIPEPGEEYFIRIRSVNTGVPASNSNLIVDTILVQDMTKVGVEINAGRGFSAIGRSLPVVVNSVGTTVAVTSTPQPSATQAQTNTAKILSAASTNATNLKTTSGRIFGAVLANTTATWKYFRVYNKASAPTVGTDSPAQVYPIPPNSTIVVQIGGTSVGNPTVGIGYAITGGSPDLDATAVAVGDVVGALWWL